MKQKNFILSLSLFLFCTNYCLIPTRVILATDTNKNYLEFWPVVAKVWKEAMGIQSTLAFIADENVVIDETLGDVIRFPPIPGIPTSLQAQAIRLLLPVLFPDDICIISDIDMIPVDRHYFRDSMTGIMDNCFVVFRDKAHEYEKLVRYPMCYNAASGKMFQEIFQIKSILEIEKKIKEWHSLNLGWNTDEVVLYNYLKKWPHFATRCIKLGHPVSNRLDRSRWKITKDVSLSNYIDIHCPRPYSSYKSDIDRLVTLILAKD